MTKTTKRDRSTMHLLPRFPALLSLDLARSTSIAISLDSRNTLPGREAAKNPSLHQKKAPFSRSSSVSLERWPKKENKMFEKIFFSFLLNTKKKPNSLSLHLPPARKPLAPGGQGLGPPPRHRCRRRRRRRSGAVPASSAAGERDPRA